MLHLYLSPPQEVTPSEFREDVDADKAIESLGYRVVKKTVTIC